MQIRILGQRILFLDFGFHEKTSIFYGEKCCQVLVLHFQELAKDLSVILVTLPSFFFL